MPRARVRRPLIALIVLIVALVIGYTVKAVHSDDDHGGGRSHSPRPSVSQSR